VSALTSIFIAQELAINHPKRVKSLVLATAATGMPPRTKRIESTWAMAAKEDLLLPVKVSEELASGIPDAKLVVLEGGGHGFNGEIADKFNKAVLDFLCHVA
jgi:pimeloyl-ACP methyl ester carboxylesterase